MRDLNQLSLEESKCRMVEVTAPIYRQSRKNCLLSTDFVITSFHSQSETIFALCQRLRPREVTISRLEKCMVHREVAPQINNSCGEFDSMIVLKAK